MKNTIIDNEQFTKPLIAKLSNWRYFFEILAKLGLNLHDLNGNYSRVALIMPCPSPFDLKQVLGRVHRAGGKSKSIQYIVYAAGVGIEENICSKLDGKLKQMDTLMDGEIDATISLAPKPAQ